MIFKSNPRWVYNLRVIMTKFQEINLMKRIIVLFLTCGLIFSLTACSAQATPVYAEGEEKDAAAASAEPFAQHILDGIQNNDYETFAVDFNPSMRSAMTQGQFDKIVTMFADYGAFKSRELINVQIIDSFYRVNYQLTFEKKTLIMGVVIPQGETPDVSGLWFN